MTGAVILENRGFDAESKRYALHRKLYFTA